MYPIRCNSLLVHVVYPQILGTSGLVFVVVVVINAETCSDAECMIYAWQIYLDKESLKPSVIRKTYHMGNRCNKCNAFRQGRSKVGRAHLAPHKML